jgi:hypothetical protein
MCHLHINFMLCLVMSHASAADRPGRLNPSIVMWGDPQTGKSHSSTTLVNVLIPDSVQQREYVSGMADLATGNEVRGDCFTLCAVPGLASDCLCLPDRHHQADWLLLTTLARRLVQLN